MAWNSIQIARQRHKPILLHEMRSSVSDRDFGLGFSWISTSCWISPHFLSLNEDSKRRLSSGTTQYQTGSIKTFAGIRRLAFIRSITTKRDLSRLKGGFRYGSRTRSVLLSSQALCLCTQTLIGQNSLLKWIDWQLRSVCCYWYQEVLSYQQLFVCVRVCVFEKGHWV